jgi:hypothetical protein
MRGPVSHRTLRRLDTDDVLTQGEGATSRPIAVPHDRIEAVMRACADGWPSVTTVSETATGCSVRTVGW